jgi:hypothetical protein
MTDALKPRFDGPWIIAACFITFGIASGFPYYNIAFFYDYMPNVSGNAGSFTNGLPMTASLGCGTWGGNITSENISVKHYMNTTWVSRLIAEDRPTAYCPRTRTGRRRVRNRRSLDRAAFFAPFLFDE